MKKSNLIAFVLSLLLTAAAALSLTSCGMTGISDPYSLPNASVSVRKRTPADHEKFKITLLKQGYIDGEKCNEILFQGGLAVVPLALNVILNRTPGCYYEFDYDWYYDYDFKHDEELEKLIQQDSIYTAYEIGDLTFFGIELEYDLDGSLEFFTFDNGTDADRCAKLLIENIGWGSDHVYKDIIETDYSRYSIEDDYSIGVAARVENTVIYYFGDKTSPAYKVLEKLGYN